MSDAPFIKTRKEFAGRFWRYNLSWGNSKDPASLELDMIAHGGQWRKQDGELAGEGNYHHYRRFQEIVWPERIWEKGPYKNYWAEKILEAWLQSTYLGLMGCAASSKSDSLGAIALTDWYAFPDCTTTLVSSTDLKMLELRIWGMIKKYHKAAKKERDWMPGHLIEGKQMILQDARAEFTEGRDYKNSVVGVPCKRGNQWVGLGSYIGIHNKRVRLIADESNLMVKGFLDSTANLSKCEDFKMAAPGNPNETTNAHGILCEPAPEIGGWEGGIDQSPGTKIWKTRYPNGWCLQLPGSDSPNLKAPLEEEPPFPFLITRQQLEDDAKVWGKDDWHYAMFDDAKMPRGQGSHRVVTRQECEKFGATLEPMWRDSNIVKIASLDAAYRGAGGDRCVFTELNFGKEVESTAALVSNDSLVSVKSNVPQGRQIMAIVDQVVIPIEAGVTADTPEKQIRIFCKEQCDRRGIPYSNFFYDAGMRTSLVQEFASHWTTETQSIDCGSSPTEERVSAEIDMPCHDYYKKLVTELWFSIRMVIIARQFRNLGKDVMWELCAREWKTSPGNKIEVESKVEMKEKTGRSPDLADSLSLAVFGARKRGFQIARLQPPKNPNRGPDWRDELRKQSEKIWSVGALEHASA